MAYPDQDGSLPDDTLGLIEDVAPRFGLALANAEELADRTASLYDDTRAAASHATLSALAILLALLEVLPAPDLNGESDTQLYEEMAGQSKRLGGLVEQFLDSFPET